MVIFSVFIFRKNKRNTQSYQLLSSNVRMDLRHLAIILSRSVKIYPLTEKMHVNQASKISYHPRKRDLQARAVIAFERL